MVDVAEAAGLSDRRNRDPLAQQQILSALDPLPPEPVARGCLQMRAEQPAQLLSLIHISEPTRLLSTSYGVFCLKKKTTTPVFLQFTIPFSHTPYIAFPPTVFYIYTF